MEAIYRQKEKYIRKAILLIIIAIIQALTIPNVYGAIYTATQDGDWSDRQTWGNAGVPGDQDEAIIPAGITVNINGLIAVKDLLVESNGTARFTGTLGNGLTISNGGGLLIEADGQILDNGKTNTFIRFAPANRTAFDYNFTCNGLAEMDYLYVDNYGRRYTISGMGVVEVFNNFTITEDNMTIIFDPGITVNIYEHIYLEKNDKSVKLENSGVITVGGDIYNGNPGQPLKTHWVNKKDAVLNLAGIFDPRIKLNAADENNIINYNGTGSKIIKDPEDNYYHLHIRNTNTRTPEDHLDVNGDLWIADTAVLDMDVYNTNVAGNWINNSLATDPFVENNCITTLDGAAMQEVRTPNNERFCQLVIDNSGAGVTLAEGNSFVKTALTLTDGLVYTNTNNLLIVEDNATSTAGSYESFVHGPMQKTGDDAFVFPVGKDTVWARLGLSDLANADPATEFICEYFFEHYYDTSTLEQSWKDNGGKVSHVEYWNVDRYDFGDDAGATVTLHWEDSARSGITDPTDLVVAHWQVDQWENYGSSGTTGGNFAGSVSSGGVLSSFGAITFGSGTGLNPLPIQLAYFSAEKKDEVVILNWVSENEYNTDHYVVERSTDGINFHELGKLSAHTGMKKASYSYPDEAPASGINYYRLKSADMGGNAFYSEIRSIKTDAVHATFAVYPNPVQENREIHLKTDRSDYHELKVVNQFGKVVYEAGANTTGNQIKLPDLAAGIYFLILEYNDEVRKQKLVME